jgi:Fe-S cluster assembly iron-binding protein IscA
MYNLCPLNLINWITKEAIMLNVTEKANEMISNFLKDREDPSYIRIFLSQGG